MQEQRAEIGDSGVEEKDIRERLAWEKEILGELRGDEAEREKVQQVFDRRMKGDERQALDEVLK